MANNRYFMLCDCGSTHYIAKSLGDGLYTADTTGMVTESLYDWMWDHLMECEHPNATHEPVLGPEWTKGEVFKVVTEYDDRVGGGNIPPYHRDKGDTNGKAA